MTEVQDMKDRHPTAAEVAGCQVMEEHMVRMFLDMAAGSDDR